MNENVLADALVESAWVTARIATVLSLAIAVLGSAWAYVRARAAREQAHDGQAAEPGSTLRALAMIAAFLAGTGLAYATRGEATRWLPGLLQGFVAGTAAIAACAAAVLVVWSARTLGRSLAIRTFAPVRGALVTTGPYAIVRHPFYVSIGMLLAAGGFALASLSGTALGLVLYGAAARWRAGLEDRALARALGPEFEEFRERVPGFRPRI
ncbi:MAG: methyltransferase family protein [Candidatus Eiseniibacteriota bacterium]